MSIRMSLGKLTAFFAAIASTLCGLSVHAAEVDASVLKAEQQRIQAIAEAKKSAVSVFVPSGAGGGSGVVISEDGYALTNFHVSSPAGAHMVCGMANGNVYDTVIVGVDPVGDLALIKLLSKREFSPVELGDSDAVDQGDWCMVIGNPFLLANDLQPTVTWGLISGTHRYQYPSGTLLEYADCLQTDASINPGNSGGPLYDAQSRLIGIVGRASFEKRGRVNVGVGYAISVNQAKNFLGYLHSGRIIDHGTLGATVSTDDGRVVVSNILDSSDAYRRGLRYGAEILEVNGRPVDTANSVQNVLGTLPKGWRIPVTFRYDGKTQRTLIRLAGVHGGDELLEKMQSSMPPPPPRPQEKKGDAEKDKIKVANAKEKKLPDSIAEIYEAKRGFANYYFNRKHQERLWDLLKKQTPSTDGDWSIGGPTEDDGPVLAMAVGEQVTMKADDGEQTQLDEASLFESVADGQVGGFAACLNAWHRLVDLGLEDYGDVYYLGTMPLRGEYPLREVLVAEAGELEARFFFHPDSGKLEAIECWADRFSDPAELLIGDFESKPKTLSLHYGIERYSQLKVDKWETKGGSES